MESSGKFRQCRRSGRRRGGMARPWMVFVMVSSFARRTHITLARGGGILAIYQSILLSGSLQSAKGVLDLHGQGCCQTLFYSFRSLSRAQPTLPQQFTATKPHTELLLSLRWDQTLRNSLGSMPGSKPANADQPPPDSFFRKWISLRSIGL